MRRSLFILILILAVGLVGCGGSDGLTPDGAEFNVPVGDNVTIRLDSNPSTGYSWKLATVPPEGVLELVDERFKPDDGGDGAGGVQIFNFRAIGAGTTVVEVSEVDDAGAVNRSRSHSVTVTAG